MNINNELAVIEKMTVGELHERYAELFGEEPRSRHRIYLIRKIAWRLQANAEGDLSERARRRAAELATDSDVRTTPPRGQRVRRTEVARPTSTIRIPRDSRLPTPGTSITRRYKGAMIEVRVLDEGFEYEHERYKTLSAVAKVITGSHCNGFRFFNLKEKA